MSACFARLRLLSPLLLFCLPAALAIAQEKEPPLPLKRVVLFSSSVGFYEHAGEVDGNKQIEFSFKTEDINDLLKSLVVQDRDGGVVTAVNYGSPEPITRTLRTFTIDLTDSPTLAQIFEQLRGQEVRLETPNPVSGTVVGVERRLVTTGPEKYAEVDVVNVRTTEGLRSVKLEPSVHIARRRSRTAIGWRAVHAAGRLNIGRAGISTMAAARMTAGPRESPRRTTSTCCKSPSSNCKRLCHSRHHSRGARPRQSRSGKTPRNAGASWRSHPW